MPRVRRDQIYRSGRRCNQRRGAFAIELIMVLLVLILATFVSLQFGIALIVKQAVAEASTVAAREAAKGATLNELTCDINRVLAGHQIMIGSNASYVLEDPLPEPLQGTLPCSPPATPLLDGDEVRVTLCVSLTAHPILNILQMYGIDYTGRKFMISSVATRE
jgi:TadE-like protein